jgi:hypothetical protein
MAGRPRLKETELRGRNDARADLTANARVACSETRNVLKSLQPCSLKDNRRVLHNILEKTSPSQLEQKNKILGLIAVLDAIQCEHIGQDGKAYDSSFLRFDAAMELFFAHYNKGPPFINTDKDKFMYAMLHEKWGLCVYIVFMEHLNHRLIVLRPDSCNIETFLDMISRPAPSRVSENTLQLTAENVKEILATVDTEWDRKVARVLLAAERSGSKIDKLGISSDSIKSDTLKVSMYSCSWVAVLLSIIGSLLYSIDTIFYFVSCFYVTINLKVQDVAKAWRDANEEASDMVVKQLNARKRKLLTEIDEDTQRLSIKRGKWSSSALADMEEELQQKQDRLTHIEDMLSSPTEKRSSELDRNFSQMKKRKARAIFEENRVKKRAKTTQGNKSLIDSEDEDFIAKSIEDKATYHGRRHDLVLYTNRRVKKRDLLNIANYRLASRNKKLIKSATTVYNRCKPRSSRSIQAKRHKGKGLFCTKKPPKAEDIDNENTHYQRAHVKNVKFSFFGQESAANSQLCFMRSIDDKAYLRPGTSEGFQNTRNRKILTLTDVEKARQLPKYDWPEKLVYQTPGSHRIFTKTPSIPDDINNEEKLLTEDDNHFVFIRPKAIIGSSGSTWASETIRLRQRNPSLFEVDNSSNYSLRFRQICSIIQCACFQYQDMAEEEDLLKATCQKDCVYTRYECER